MRKRLPQLTFANVMATRSILLTVAALALYPAASALAAPAAPNTKITSGPSGLDPLRSATFDFKATVGGATFQCSLDGKAWSSCASPKEYTGLALGPHKFRVRALTKGSVDPTPAVRSFTVETPQAAAKLYFPDTVKMDVPADCSGSFAVDCPGGKPLPPADQLEVASTRSVSKVAAGKTYDVTVTSNVQTLQQIVVSTPTTGDCDMTMTSANGSMPDWTVTVSLTYVTRSGKTRLQTSNLTISGIESADITVTGGLGCSLSAPLIATHAGPIYASTLQAYFDKVGDPMCALKRSPYVGPCPH